jgi:hypothetical protein
LKFYTLFQMVSRDRPEEYTQKMEERNMTQDRPLIAEDAPIACSLAADERAVRRAQITALFAGIQQVRELDDGYALAFPGQAPWPQQVLSFIEGERSCCLFFTFELTFLPNNGPLWLHIRGPQGVKDILPWLSLTQSGPPAQG